MVSEERLRIESIASGSEAERIGLRAGDEILMYNNKNVHADPSLFSKLLSEISDQDEIEIKVERDGQPHTFTVKGGKLGVRVSNNSKIDYVNNFKALSGYGSLISGTGWVIVIFSILAFIIGLISIVNGTELELGGYTLMFSGVIFGISGLLLVVAGQIVSCFISIERNTRSVFKLLKEKLP